MHQNFDIMSRKGYVEQGRYEVAYQWFGSRKKAEAFCMMRVKSRN